MLVVLIAIWLWCRSLERKVNAPSYVRWLPKALFVCWLGVFSWTAVSLFIVYRTIQSGVDPAMKSELLADGIADAMNRSAFAFLPFLLAVPLLVWTSFRLRGASTPQR